MRVFQNLGISKTYTDVENGGGTRVESYDTAIAAFLHSRYGAPHILKPIFEGVPDARLAIGNNPALQKSWAREHGFKYKNLSDILLAQIEDFRADVLYNCDPLSFGDDFLRRLPGSVRRTVAWSAAPHGTAQFFGHDVIVCNFPNILARYEAAGARTTLLHPAHDEVMEEYHSSERDIDIVFAGSYSRHHAERNLLLNTVASLSEEFSVTLCVQPSRVTRIAELAGKVLPIPAKYKRPPELQKICNPPRYGRDLYALLGRAKIVLNGAIGMAGNYRGNLRVWEGTGAGGLLLSDGGIYPEGFEEEVNFVAYSDPQDMVRRVRELLRNGEAAREISRRGHELIRDRYSKARQWEAFVQVCA